MVNLELNTSSIRLFSHIFIYKFLDITHGNLSLSGRKKAYYETETITFTFYKKNDVAESTATYNEYSRIPSYEIDFSRKYSIKAPRGLCREIERHYLTYLHQCNPLVFISYCPHITSDLYFINYLAHSTPTLFEKFLEKNGLSFSDGLVNSAIKRKVADSITQNTKAIEYGITLHLPTKSKELLLWSLLKKHMFEPSNCIIPLKDHYYLLDYRVFGILYDSITSILFDDHNGPIKKEEVIHAEWLRREGEETYIYYSDDELITKVGEISLAESKKTIDNLILCPLSAEHNKFIPRRCYEEVLKKALSLSDALGFSLPVKEGKRVIHFKKMSIKEALPIYEEIIKSDPERYLNLRVFVNNFL